MPGLEGADDRSPVTRRAHATLDVDIPYHMAVVRVPSRLVCGRERRLSKMGYQKLTCQFGFVKSEVLRYNGYLRGL